MKRFIFIGLAIVLFIFTINGTTFAELTSTDWKTVGDNNITYDSDTGLEWLDISVTLEISTDEMLAELQPGGEYYGFRYATVAELNELTAALGIIPSGYFAPMVNVAGVRKMHNLFGGVYIFWGNNHWYTHTVYGYTVDILTGQVRRQEYGFKHNYTNCAPYNYVVTTGNLYFDESTQCRPTGHFIVKDEVVEPVEVTIDIKPGGCPTPFNVTDEGDFSVAVLGTKDFDITEIDLSSIMLEGVAQLRSSIEDISQPLNVEMCIEEGLEEEYYDYEQVDGYDDLVLKFTTQEIVAVIGDVKDGDIVELTLTATLVNGTEIEGANVVLIIDEDLSLSMMTNKKK